MFHVTFFAVLNESPACRYDLQSLHRLSLQRVLQIPNEVVVDVVVVYLEDNSLLSSEKLSSLSLRCHRNLILLLNASRSSLSFALSMSVGVGEKFRPFDRRLMSSADSSFQMRLLLMLLLSTWRTTRYCPLKNCPHCP